MLTTDHEGVDSLTQGVAQYQALGVPPAKLVTIFAWFGMDVQCTNTSGGCALEYPHCYAKGTGDGHDCQPGYSTIVHDLLPRNTHPPGSTGWGPLGLVQRDQFGLPYFDYAGNMSKRHRVRFSDRNSTAVRSKWARDASLGGVGIWTADALDTLTYPEDGVEMWGALLGPPPPPAKTDDDGMQPPPPPPPPSAHIWFWSPLPCCDAAGLPIGCPEPVTISGSPPRWNAHGQDANCSFLPRAVLQKARAGPPFMTGAFANVGHSIQDNGTFVFPSEATIPTLKRDIRDLHALNITVEPMIAGASQAQLAALLYNSSAREGFISAFVNDAVENGYDGFHLVRRQDLA